MERPEFDNIKTYEEFSKYYWYRDELIAICKAHGLKAPSGKIELNKVIEAYFNGEKILPEKKKAGGKKKFQGELTLETGLIECGFTFGPKFREFFIKQTGVEKFRFNVDMVATAKAVKENGDESFTLGDLLDIYHGKKTYAIYDKSALQWNQFMHDFCGDDATKSFHDRLKAAAALWKIVRNSDREKKYSHELLEEYAECMKSF
ncbi:MAG: SAP domain-containing protein [Lachnospiraceae bacterium]|nr:SAP domain-containing protein [Lachnospiraceae bacterium]